MPNYKKTKKSVKNARISKHKKSKSLINKMKGGYEFEYSNDLINWSKDTEFIETHMSINKSLCKYINSISSEIFKYYEINKATAFELRVVFTIKHLTNTLFIAPFGHKFVVINDFNNTFFYLSI
jgi:hypothetical protein